MRDEVTFIDAFEAYKRRVHELLDDSVVKEAVIGNLKKRIQELEQNHEPVESDEGGVDPEE